MPCVQYHLDVMQVLVTMNYDSLATRVELEHYNIIVVRTWRYLARQSGGSIICMINYNLELTCS